MSISLRDTRENHTYHVCSFGVITMCKMSTWEPFYPDRKYDFKLALDIIEGLSPKISEGTLNVTNSCLDADSRKRSCPKQLSLYERVGNVRLRSK